MLTRPAVAVAALAALAVPLTGTARADGPDITAGECDLISFCTGVRVERPAPGSPGDGRRPTGGGGSAKSGGDFAVNRDCRVRPLQPQPPAGSSLWEGRDPEDGAIYVRICPTTGPLGLGQTQETFWAANPPEEEAVDPTVLAQQALDKMALRGPDIISPTSAGRYSVGVPMWLQVGRSATTYGPNRASASAGGVTVTATARVTRIVWDMGDGSSVTCTGPGSPYRKGYGMRSSPDCGHRYTTTSASRSSGRFTVTATSTWQVQWTATTGESGEVTTTRQSEVAIGVGEAQAVGS
ncbi:hypothetical protein [Streptomyces megasporus]|uniref:hypothetical protein n=1 Tax=Streptomyces megasporus TaxID=44060 RepID=UPI0004E1106D|nr:hypothetical protein [Streptomyces megasporus]